MGNQNLGLCKCCWNDVGATTLEHISKPAKLKPLIVDLEKAFQAGAGADGVLDRDELCKIWRKSAKRHLGKLSAEDKETINSQANRVFSLIDKDHSGKISYEEFMAHMMGSQEDAHAKMLREQLDKQLESDPTNMKTLIRLFKSWDKNGDGFVTADELDQSLQELESFSADPSNVNNALTKADSSSLQNVFTAANIKADDLRKIRENIFTDADVNGDGKVDLWEAIAYMLGRKKQPVEVLIYDISGGNAEWIGPLLLGRKVEMVHSAVLVYGSEFWYGGNVFKSDPPCSKQFGNPLPHPWNEPLPTSEVRPDLPVVKVGYTFVRHDEFVKFLQKEIVPRYNGIEKYDLLTHNCCNFSDEIVTFLTGTGIPSRILEIQKVGMTPTIKALRPYLNKYLGGFGDAGKGDFEDDTQQKSATNVDNPLTAHFGSGSPVLFKLDGEELVGTVVGEEGDMCQVKYFDAVEATMKTTKIPQKALASSSPS
jgi:Ca2+-binding EF-hand superfamily protein